MRLLKWTAERLVLLHLDDAKGNLKCIHFKLPFASYYQIFFVNSKWLCISNCSYLRDNLVSRNIF